MNTALIVLCHPNPASFNHHLAAIAKNNLTGQGFSCRILDIYKLDLPPSISMDDFTHEVNLSDFDYKEEQKKAFRDKTFHPAIRDSQQAINDADLIIFQFPLWWFSLPAALKNWIEKCFTFDFAYNGREKRWFNHGPFNGKKAILSFTTSGPEHIYSENGINGDIRNILWPLHNGILNFTGLSVLPPVISWASDTHNKDNRQVLENKFLSRLKTIRQEKPIAFHSLECFDERYVLKGVPCIETEEHCCV